MDKEPTAFSLNPEQMAHLLSVGSDTDEVTGGTALEEKKSELLHDLLEQSLPLDSSAAKMLPDALGELRNTIGALTGEPIGRLLQNPRTDVSVIRKIKDYGKKLSMSADSEIDLETANTIYYAAIGICQVNHDLRITKFSYKDLEHSFNLLGKRSWIPKYLRDIFKKASQHCKLKMKK